MFLYFRVLTTTFHQSLSWLFLNNHLKLMILSVANFDVYFTRIFLKKGQILYFLKIEGDGWTIFELKALIGVIAAPADSTLSPRYRQAYTTPAAETAIAAVFVLFWHTGVILNILHKLLHFKVLLSIILNEVVE